jgi:hypothetical protein
MPPVRLKVRDSSPWGRAQKSESKDKIQWSKEILKVARSIDKIYNFAF